jgi:hypothetical protein
VLDQLNAPDTRQALTALRSCLRWSGREEHRNENWR